MGLCGLSVLNYRWLLQGAAGHVEHAATRVVAGMLKPSGQPRESRLRWCGTDWNADSRRYAPGVRLSEEGTGQFAVVVGGKRERRTQAQRLSLCCRAGSESRAIVSRERGRLSC